MSEVLLLIITERYLCKCAIILDSHHYECIKLQWRQTSCIYYCIRTVWRVLAPPFLRSAPQSQLLWKDSGDKRQQNKNTGWIKQNKHAIRRMSSYGRLQLVKRKPHGRVSCYFDPFLLKSAHARMGAAFERQQLIVMQIIKQAGCGYEGRRSCKLIKKRVEGNFKQINRKMFSQGRDARLEIFSYCCGVLRRKEKGNFPPLRNLADGRK